MIANFLNNEALTSKFISSFSYRYSDKYSEGMHSRIICNSFSEYPLKLKDASSWYQKNKSKKSNNLFNYILRIIQLPMRYIFLVLNIILLFKLFKKIKPDILHINNGGYPGAYSCMAAVFAGSLCGVNNIIYVVNNIAETYRAPSRWIDFFLDKLVARKVAIFVTGSKYASLKLAKVLKLDNNKFTSIHNGISIRQIFETRFEVKKRLYISDNEISIGMVANFEERKGHKYLIDAIKEIYNSNNNIKIKAFLEGTGVLEKELREYVKFLNLEDKIIFIGEEKRIFDFIDAMNIIVVPSIENEDFPNVILEAMSLGKAIIASNIAGIPEQISDMKSGILVEPRREDKIAEAILMLAQEKELRDGIGANAINRFNFFFTDVIAVKNYMNLYYKLFEDDSKGKINRRKCLN
jgi:glycosyltransferase involved in cell wall biosynthesis